MKKKKLMALFLAGTMVLSLAACGGGNKSSDESSEATSGDENTLTVAAWDPSFNIPALQAAAEDYKANVNPDLFLKSKNSLLLPTLRQRSQPLLQQVIMRHCRTLFCSRITGLQTIMQTTRMHGRTSTMQM